jgi:hemerythrin
MALIQWDDSLSVNVVEIDRQHKKLVSMINELNDAMSEGKGKDILGKIIHDLIDYTQTHFQTEETYFEQFKYPETDRHKKEHSNFTQKVVEFQDKFSAGELGLSIRVLRFLCDWLKNHIKGSDKDYGPFFNEKGLK